MVGNTLYYMKKKAKHTDLLYNKYSLVLQDR